MVEIELPKDLPKDQANLLSELISQNVAYVGSLLPLAVPSFRVLVDDNQCIPEWGVGGYCENSSQIEIALAPARENDWKLHLPRTIAHEWHHLARWGGPGYGTTLAEVIISEGLAQHFEVECFPGPPSFFSLFLKPEDRTTILTRFTQEMHLSEFDHARWFFGKGEFPFQAGYDLSFNVIGEYLKVANSIAAKEVGLTSKRLLEVLPGLGVILG